MDSLIHCIYDTETLGASAPFGEINIGDNVWLNMHTAVIKWGGVSDGCVTTRYAFIGKPISPNGSNCLLSGQPAKIIKRNVTQVHNFSTEKLINRFFNSHMGYPVISLNLSQVANENLCNFISR